MNHTRVGTDSPNPSFPQDINVVTGENVVSVIGKNLFDIDNAYHGTINASGVIGGNEAFRTTQYINTTPGQKYYFSTTQISGQTSKQIYIAYYDTNKNFVSRTSYQELTGNFTTPNNCYYMRAGVFTQCQENIMLEKGVSGTTYEAYTSQSYPINLEGKNKYNTNATALGTISQSDGKTISTSDSILYTKDYIRIEPNTQYTLSYNGSTGIGIRLFYYDKNGNYINTVVASTGSNKATFTTISTAYKLRMQFNQSYNNDLQLEKGSTATTYEAYHSIELAKIVDYKDSLKRGTGKNLFDGVWESGTIDSSTGENQPNGSARRTENYIPIKPNTKYTLSRNTTTDSVPLRYYDENKTYLGSANGLLSGEKSKTFISINNAYYLRLVDWENSNSNVMLEKGSTATEYEPYGFKDKWYIHSEIGKVILDGSEYWILRNDVQTSDGYYTFRNGSYLGDGGIMNNTIGFSNYFPITTSGTTNKNNIRLLSAIYYGTQICIDGNIATTREALQTWLTSHNVVVYYPSSISSNTEITDTTLISQLEAIHLKSGINNISIDGDTAVSGFTVKFIGEASEHL